MLDKFIDWCRSLEPIWVGFVCYLTVSFSLFLLVVAALVFLLTVTNGWVLLVAPVFIIYVWYIALFKQKGKRK